MAPSFLAHEELGNVRIFCRGRFVMGPDWRMLVTSAALIFVCSLVFITFTNTITTARVFVGIFSVLTLIALAVCAFSDPGVSPKDPLPDTPAAASTVHDPQQVNLDYIAPDGTSKTAVVERRWCYSCNRYRPPRGVHCRFCDVCVVRRDHHCPWTGICIGAFNYKSYFALVWCAFLLMITSFIGGVHSLSRRASAVNASNVGTDHPPSGLLYALAQTWWLELILILISFFWGILVGSLSFYHTYLITQNQTSGDSVKQMEENIYHQGSLSANIRSALCFTVDPSVLASFTGRGDGGEGNTGAGAFNSHDTTDVVIIDEDAEA